MEIKNKRSFKKVYIHLIQRREKKNKKIKKITSLPSAMAEFLFKCKVHLGAYSFSSEFLSLYKTACKIFLPNSYQILLYAFLNVVYIRHSMVIFSFEKKPEIQGSQIWTRVGARWYVLPKPLHETGWIYLFSKCRKTYSITSMLTE